MPVEAGIRDVQSTPLHTLVGRGLDFGSSPEWRDS